MADLNPLNYLIEKLESGVHALRVKQTGSIVELINYDLLEKRGLDENDYLVRDTSEHNLIIPHVADDLPNFTTSFNYNKKRVFEQLIVLYSDLDEDLNIKISGFFSIYEESRQEYMERNMFGTIFNENLPGKGEFTGSRIVISPEKEGTFFPNGERGQYFSLVELRQPFPSFEISWEAENTPTEGGFSMLVVRRY